MMLRIFILIVLFSQCAALLAQNLPVTPCATDELLEKSSQKCPELRVKQQQLEYWMQQWTDRPQSQSKINSAGITIPVVVHIVHQNGPENVSDNRVFTALQHLNEAFAHAGAYGALGPGTSTEIQFCLAQRTPENTSTNGITRHESPLTNMIMDTIDNYLLKDIGRWNTRDYLNVWVVNEISAIYGGNPAGYANYAFEHGSDYDGIVVEAGYFGNSAANDVVLIHEVGHYLNLLHTFSGGCDNINCRLQGDYVCDTPPDASLGTGCSLFNSCHTDTDDVSVHNPLTTDERDFTENYMDYAPFECQYAFTPGQVVRMMAALNTARLSLYESQGCQPPCPVTLAANFMVPQVVVAGHAAIFTQSTTGNISSNSWWIDGTLVATTADLVHTFDLPGTYTVDLIVENGAGCQAQKRAIIQVKCADIFIDLNLAEFNIGDTVQISAIGTGAESWAWTVEGVPSGNTPTVSHVFEAYGIYQVQLVYQNAFCADTLTREVIVNPDCGAEVMQNAYHLEGDRMYTYSLPDGGFFGTGYQPFDPTQMFVARFSAGGALLWAKALDHDVFVGPIAFIILEDGNYLITVGAQFAQTIVIKMTPQGAILWQKRYSINGFVHKFITTADGAMWMLSTNYLLKLDADGNSFKILRPDITREATFLDIHALADGNLALSASLPLDSVWCFMIVDPQNYQVVAQRAYKSWAGQIETHILPDGGWVWQQFTNKDIIHCLNEDLSPRWSKSSPNKPQYRTFIVKPNRFGDLLAQAEWNISDTRYTLLTANGNQRWTVKIVTNENNFQLSASQHQNGWLVTQGGLPSGDQYIFTFPNRNRPEGCFIQDAEIVFADESLVPVEVTTFLVEGGTSVVTFPENLLFTDRTFGRTNLCTVPNPCPEICDNGMDDDGDGLADCADDECDCQPCLTLPNAVIQSVDSVWCDGQITKVRLTLCNTGGGVLPAQTPVAFYDGNPTAALGAAPLATVQTIGTDVLPGTCWSGIFDLNSFNGTVFVVLNNDYSAALPLALNNNFVTSGPTECNYVDNMSQFSVQIPNAPQLDIGEDRLVCPGTATVLNATPGFVRYRWPDGSNALSYTAPAPGLYRVMAWDACGNMHTDSVRLTPQPLSQVSLGDDVAICHGATATLNITGFDEVNWWPSTGLSCADCPNVNISPATSTVYHVTALKGACLSTDSIRITVIPRPVVSLGADVSLCSGESATLGTVPENNVEYAWNTGASGAALTVSSAGTYLLTANIGAQCAATDTVVVTVNALPVVDLGATVSLCTGDTMVIGTVAQAGVSYLWSDGLVGPSRPVQMAGTYELTAISGADCMSSDSVTVNTVARPVVSLGADVSLCSGESVTLGTEPENNVEYTWNTGASGATLTVSSAGTYLLTANIGAQCAATDTVVVTVNALPVVDLGATVSLCTGDTMVIGTVAQAGVSYLWSDGLVGPSRPVQMAGTYELTAISGADCMSSDTVAVNTVARPVVSLGADVSLCSGESVTLGTVPENNVEYAWNTGASGAELTVSSAGTYLLTANIGAHCAATDTVVVTVNALPVVELGATVSLCTGDTMVIGTVAQAGVSYLWSDGLVGPSRPVQMAGTYELTAISGADCMSSDSVTVNTVARPVVSLGADVSLCSGESVTLGTVPENNVAYTWNTGASGAALTVSSAGMYLLTANIGAHCAATDTVVVSVNALPVVDLGATVSLCTGDTMVIGTVAQAGVSYLWSDGLVGPSRPVQMAGTYELTAISGADCMSSDTVTVNTVARPMVSLGADVSLCSGESATLSTVPENNVAYTWNTGASGAELTVSSEGTYLLTANIGAHCAATDTVVVTVNALPVVELGATVSLCTGDTMVIGTVAQAGVSYLWSDGLVGPSRPVQMAGTYELTAISGADCMSSDTVAVNTTDCTRFSVFIPNIFAPTGAAGNDRFLVNFPEGTLINDFELHVFDRWGNHAFSTTNPSDSWDGRIKGTRGNTGVYVYQCRFKYQWGNERGEITQKGDVLLLE